MTVFDKAWSVLKAWPEDDFADHSGFANPDGTPYEGDQEGLMQQRIQEIADVHNMSLADLYRIYGWDPDEHTGHSPEEIAQVEEDWDHPWHDNWDNFENAIQNKNSIKAHTNNMLDSGVRVSQPYGGTWTKGTTDPNWIQSHADDIARSKEFYNDLYGHYTAESAQEGDGLMGHNSAFGFSNHDDNPALNWNPPLEQTHGKEWFDKKHFPNKNPLTETSRWQTDHEGNRRRDMKNDAFRMKKPDMQAELEEMAAEMARRTGRKKLKNLFNEDGTGKPEFDKYGAMHRDRELPVFDQDNPQNERLINVTQPHMDERRTLLEEEMARRRAKRGGQQ